MTHVDCPHIEPIVGRYLHVSIEGIKHRIYFEESGSGIPLVCLHTAGSDGRQYRALMNDADVTRHFRVIAFDMPRHGKSSPPEGWHQSAEDYQLTSNHYVAQVLAVTEALDLDQPVIMGCSIGGRIVLHLAEQHSEKFRALIGLQCSAHVQPYYDVSWLHQPDVHGGEVCGSVAMGLMAPMSPDTEKHETAWHYMQGGPGIFKGDLYFYKIEGDMRERLDNIQLDNCKLFLLTGEYDFSCIPEATYAVAQRIAGAKVTIMKEMGHFPMSENPDKFRDYLLPVLDQILQ